ncbi:DUF2971 domain-containing protein [Colwellia sp. MB02u-9]|uniref:DUF2971 domain-containing protein n=1 Tax=Colwellia sp. MB02u-9 TaxID=2759823 RepID=UPI0015F39844|nr:DUF2971 domain-containing protein [Colwellia sp. MB02u-9]MBA6295973.1 DUF2971 domain-containing protein [Colwellia sp. MB02u-9]
MIENIYKYSPLREDFFDNLLVRGSQKFSLNDPFELTPADSMRNRDKGKCINSYFDYSVFSASETQNNLLMWSHYADEHKGIVIEFDPSKPIFERYFHKDVKALNFIDDVENGGIKKIDEGMYLSCFSEEIVIDVKESQKRQAINAGHLHRVRYNKNRPVIDQYENILEHFLIKSDEWIYEKEHRVLLPLFDADSIVVHESHLEKINDAIISVEYMEVQKLEKGMCQLNMDSILMEDMYIACDTTMYYTEKESKKKFKSLCDFLKGLSYSNFLIDISKDSRTVFLYKVSPQAIKSIYIGCKAEKQDAENVIKKIEGNASLQHVDIYKASASSERFELSFEQIFRLL